MTRLVIRFKFRRLFLATVVLAASLALASPRARAADSDSLVTYVLQAPGSQFEWGCFGPCACPVLVQSPLTGTFVLHRKAIEPQATVYDVLDVRWKAAGDGQAVVIGGSGIYRRTNDVVVREQLTLDLSFNGAPTQHFDSGLQLPRGQFPAIDLRVSLHGETCHDSVLAVVAHPLAVAGVGGRATAPELDVAPNPFAASTEVAFALPQDGRVDLGVYDVTGRRVRDLAVHEWMAGGSHSRAWDGRLSGGSSARPGIYLLRLDTSSGRTSRIVAKVK